MTQRSRILEGLARDIRRSALEQSLQTSPFEKCITASSVVPIMFWRARGEVKQPGTSAPDYDRDKSGLWDRFADFERSWTLTSILASATPLAAGWRPAF